MQKFFVGGDIGHRIPVMCKADITFGIDHAVQRHAAQLKEIHFLPVHSRNRMFGVGQSNERNLFNLPISLKCRKYVRAHRQDHRVTALELLMLITQTRQLRAAVRSHKAAQECEHHGSSLKIGQTSAVAIYIFQFEIRCNFSRGNEFTHFGAILLCSPRYRRTC